MSEFRNFDTTRAAGTYVTFECITTDTCDQPDWEMDADRLEAFRQGAIVLIGIQARAHIEIVSVRGHGVRYALDSAGIWGVESDSDTGYIAELFNEECEQLRCDMLLIAQYREPVAA